MARVLFFSLFSLNFRIMAEVGGMLGVVLGVVMVN
jgi:hypothetical protein